MHENNLRKHQLKAYEALVEVDRLFSQHKIEYYLLAGSVLGAVRHKGFIPWDDDIDIGICLKDKKKVSDILMKELSTEFEWRDLNNYPQYPRMFGKILFQSHGCVDVFPLVKTSNHIILRKVQWVKRKILFKLYKAKIGYKNIMEDKNLYARIKVKFAVVVSRVFPMSLIIRAIEKNENIYEKDTENEYYINLYSAYSMEKELIRKDWLFPVGYVNFEQGTFPTVNNIEAYLKHLYGDYMVLPSVKNRKPGHDEIF